MAEHVTTPQANLPSEREVERRLVKRRRIKRAMLWILVPGMLSLIYYLAIAPSVYQAKMEFTIQGTQKAAPDILSGIGIPAASGASNDARLVSDYLRSAAMVETLRQRWGFTQAYGRFTLDPTSYLAPGAPIERAVAFWRRRAAVDYDASANIISVTVGAYTPEDAKRLADGMLDGARTVVNRLDRQVRETALAFAQQQLNEQRRQYDEVRQRVAGVRGAQAMTLDAQATQAVQTISQIDAEIARLNVQRAGAETTYQQGAPQMRAITAQIAALQAARADAVRRAQSGPGANAAQSDMTARTALLDYEFAQRSYFAALQAYQAASHGAEGDHRYIVAFIPPHMPEMSNYWSRLWNVLAITLAAAILLGVAMLTYSVIKDHAQ